MAWQQQLRGDSLSWLLESDSPGVRYLALRDLVDTSKNELKKASKLAHRQGPISAVLAHMEKQGFWSEPGPGYLPKYFSTVWSIILLAQLGAQAEEDERICKACAYILDHALTPTGQFTASGAPSGTADCLQGNLIWALAELGCQDSRLNQAIDWMARTVTGEGIAPLTDKKASVRYYAGKRGPNFECGSNNNLPCAWGGIKVMLALAGIPKKSHTPVIKRAIAKGVDFLFSVDPALATYPSGYSSKPSGNWWKFGFPVFYVTDLLQNVEALIRLGFGKDKRLLRALDLVREKQDAKGRWLLEYDYGGKTWVDFGEKKQPNKWVTLRALRVLKAVG
jgi:hypothetical protein